MAVYLRLNLVTCVLKENPFPHLNLLPHYSVSSSYQLCSTILALPPPPHQLSMVCSVTNVTSVPHPFLSSLRGHCERGNGKIVRARGQEGLEQSSVF